MEKSDTITYVVFIASYIWMFASKPLLAGQPQLVVSVLQLSAIFVAFGILIFRNWQLQVEAAKYDIFRATVTPPDKVFDLPIKKTWLRSTAQNPLAPHLHVTSLELADKTDIAPYGKEVRRLHLTHHGTLASRLESSEGNVKFKGEIVGHSHIYNMFITENKLFPVSQEESRPEPNFVLVFASKADLNNETARERMLSVAYGLDQPKTDFLAGQPKRVKVVFQKMKSELKRLRKREVEREGYITQLVEAVKHFRIVSIREGGKRVITDQEVVGLIDTPTDVMKATDRSVQSQVRNVEDLFQLGERAKWWSTIDWKWIGIALIAISGLLLWSRPDIRASMGKALSNPSIQVFVIVVLALAVAAIYYVSKFWRKKGE